MAGVSNEPIYEVLKALQDRVVGVDSKVDEVKNELQAMRGHMLAMQQDIHNIYGILDRHDQRLDRIERRLEITESVK